jgi:hypothetical protein
MNKSEIIGQLCGVIEAITGDDGNYPDNAPAEPMAQLDPDSVESMCEETL